MADDLFGHDLEARRKAMHAKLKATRDEMYAKDEAAIEAARQAGREQMKRNAEKLILSDYASTGEKPLYSAGILISPQLAARARSMAEDMSRHVAEEKARREDDKRKSKG